MAGYTPPPLTPPGPPNDTNPDSGLLGKGGAGGSLPPEIVDNYPLAAEALQSNEISLALAQNPYLTPIEGVLGGKAVAEKNQEYFAIILECGDTSPEIIDQTQFKVTYLCDSLLNVSKPAEDTIARNNILQNFERQKRATVRVDQGTVLNQQLAGNHKITAVGSLEPIAGTQIGKGPYEYVTTMSFQLKDQLDAPPGVPVVNYYIIPEKNGGYQDLPFAYTSSGYIDLPLSNGTPIGSWTYGADIIDANNTTPAQLHYDGLNSEITGSGSRLEQTFDGNTNPTSTQLSNLGFDLNNYFNNVEFTTSSIEGYTRVKATLGASVTIITSSVNDLFVSTTTLDEPLYALATLKVFKKDTSGNTIELGSTQKPINALNQSLVHPIAGYTTNNMSHFRDQNYNQIYNLLDINNNEFSWGPLVGSNIDGANLLSSQDLVVETNFFDIEEGDQVYGELYVNNDPYISNTEFDGNNNQIAWSQTFFTESLDVHKNINSKRKYKYKWGSLKISQEVPPGQGFINGQTGVTASYGYVGDNGFVTASYYDYTSSYWVGYNNIENESSSFSYITASSALTNFYGGEYIQINPGVEEYNLFNANGSVPTPLFPNNNPENRKNTWDKFGFNPIRLPFIPLVGDFIRFEYSKQNTFQIIGINSLGGTLKLKLDGVISESTVLDNFVIYRIVENGQYIILDVKKNDEAGVNQAFSGIITAQYRSENLEARSDQLIFDLKQAGILEEGAYLSRRGYTQ